MAEYNFGGGGFPVEIEDEGTSLTKKVKKINFIGPAVTATEPVNDEINVTITETAQGSITNYPYIGVGNTSNKWLGTYESNHPSSEVPLIVKQDSDLRGWTFVNADNDVDIDIEVYRNLVLVETFEIRNKRWAYDVGITSVSFSQGDRMSVYLKKYTGGTGDQTAQDPTVEISLKVSGEASGSGGAQNGVS
jgi:hypothetical protein